MKTKDVPDRLADSDDEVAKLFASLDADVPSRDVQSSAMARIDAVAMGAASSATTSRFGIGRGVVAVGVVVAALVGVRAISREAPPAEASRTNAKSAAVTSPSAIAFAGVGKSGASDAMVTRASAVSPSIAVEDLPVANLPRPEPRAAAERSASALPAPPPVAAPIASSASRADSFREQLALVERARLELSQSRAGDCLGTLREYDAKFPSGVFTTEVKVVRVEALVAQGQTVSAIALGRALLAADPDGPYADRLRSLLSRMDP